MSIFRAIAIALAFVGLTSCAITEQHQFAEPTPDWRVRSGQLLYRTPKMTLVGVYPLDNTALQVGQPGFEPGTDGL